MDKFDAAIITELRKNARASVSAIAEQVNLSRSSVTARIKKLETSNVIQGYQVSLASSQHRGVSIYFEVQHDCRRCADVVSVIQGIPEVLACHSITGEMDLLVFVKAENMRRIH